MSLQTAPAPAARTTPRARCKKLVVFFTRGMSLDGWQRAGILDREMALYHGLSADVDRFAFVTYGGVEELKWAATGQVPRDAEILPNTWGLGSNLYSVLAPWLHRRSLRHASVFRTNQINGAWVGVIAKLLFRKPLVVRCGFLWADFVSRLTDSRWRHVVARALERLIVRSADRIVVAAPADADVIVKRYRVGRERITVVPNYVDTARFRPLAGVAPEPGRVTFIGRFEAQKNPIALVDAVAGIPGITLVLIGDGPLRSALEARSRRMGVNLELPGRLPHSELPAWLSRSQVFVLPSLYEGNPKALVEAMACGVPVVGARVPGIAEIIATGENGVLCGTSAPEIRDALKQVLGDEGLRERLRRGGIAYVRDRCSLDAAVVRERAVLSSVATPVGP